MMLSNDRRSFLKYGLFLSGLMLRPASLVAALSTPKAAVLATAVEAALAVIAQLQDSGEGLIGKWDWNLRYSPNSWSLTLSGRGKKGNVNVSLKGTLSGAPSSDMKGNYSGTA